MELCNETLEDFIKKNTEILEEENFSSSRHLTPNLIEDFNIVNKSLNAKQEKNLLKKLKVFMEITKAFNYLHTNERIIHRDIKPGE